jgi:hypothetical protein
MATSCSAGAGVAAFRCPGPSSLLFGGSKFHRRERKKSRKGKKRKRLASAAFLLFFFWLVSFVFSFLLTMSAGHSNKAETVPPTQDEKLKVANGWWVLRLLKGGSFLLLPLIGCLIPELGTNLSLQICCRNGHALWLGGSAE